MIERIISGGQTGADQAGWRAAKAAGIPTGGWMPKGFLTEDGPRPEFADLYGAKEHKSPQYPPRTRANIRWADATFIFDIAESKALLDLSVGSRVAVTTAMDYDKPCVVIAVRLGELPEPKRPAAVRDWIEEREVRVLNIAGNRESKAPGIGAWVEAYLAEVFRLCCEGGRTGPC